MSATFHIDTTLGVVFSHARDSVSDEDLLSHQRQLRQDPDFQSDLLQLYDFRAVREIKISEQGMRQLAYGNPFGRGSRRAFVVDGDYAYGIARQFQALTDESMHELAVFRDMDTARAWLGLDVPRESQTR
jgi:hypothetical protein